MSFEHSCTHLHSGVIFRARACLVGFHFFVSSVLANFFNLSVSFLISFVVSVLFFNPKLRLFPSILLRSLSINYSLVFTYIRHTCKHYFTLQLNCWRSMFFSTLQLLTARIDWEAFKLRHRERGRDGDFQICSGQSQSLYEVF